MSIDEAFERILDNVVSWDPEYPKDAIRAVRRVLQKQPEGWVKDPDTIPQEMIDACAQAILREFGQTIGTDGYYKRIIARTLAAAPEPDGD